MLDRRGFLRFATYGMIGVAGTMAQYTILVVCVTMHLLTPIVASVIGAVVGAIINYLLNARFTFRSNAHSSTIPKFAMTALLGVLINGLLMKTFIDIFWMNYLLAQIISTVIVLGITYSINLAWTFRRDVAELDTRRS